MSQLDIGQPQRKTVSYVELIYDLIFVYLVGRSNDILLENIGDGFFTLDTFSVYLMSTAVILQVWAYSVLFINRYGDNSWVDHAFLFVNMYLLYFIGSDTHLNWEATFIQYCIAWGCIYINLAVHYGLKLWSSRKRPAWEASFLKSRIALHLVQAGMIFVGCFMTPAILRLYLWAPVLVGFVGTFITRRSNLLVPVDFGHLAERVMLYIVFTFGEMIISVARYFGTGFTFRTMYFSILAFTFVASLFTSYGYIYNNALEHRSEGHYLMMLHLFMIVALNNISVSIEFMRESEVNSFDNHVFIVISLFAYYLFLFLLAWPDRPEGAASVKFFTVMIGLSTVFGILIVLAHENGWASMALTTAYALSMYIYLVVGWKKGHGLPIFPKRQLQ